jgi:two-component system response regulator FixJ
MPGVTGIELLTEMKQRGIFLPVILMTAFANVPQAVLAMKLGAVDFIEKPFDDEAAITAVRAALTRREGDSATDARERLGFLTTREKDVLRGLLQGKLNKTIAYELGVSVRTVESHRANLMAKAKVRSLPELVRMSLIADNSYLERRSG